MTQNQTLTRTASLVLFSDTTMPVLPSEEVRGRAVMDVDGQRIGKVDDLVLDRDTGRVRFLVLGSGGLIGIGRHRWLVPVDVVSDVAPDAIFLDVTKDRLDDAPEWQNWLDDPEYIGRVYAHFGRAPYWSEGYMQPDWTSRD